MKHNILENLNMESALRLGLIKENLATEEVPVRIIQFGEGNFLRAFIDWMVDEMNCNGEFNSKIVVVQPIKNGIIEKMFAQDYLYTLIERGIEGGKEYNRHRVISSVSKGINPYTEYGVFLNEARNPHLRFVFSNTTEAGIVFEPEELISGVCPLSFPAKLTTFMYERYLCFEKSPDKGLLIIPCELTGENGTRLKEAVLEYANLWKLGKDFENWVNNANVFFSTLVDRVVSGYPADEIPALYEELGYIDNFIVVSEYFHQFVIEGDSSYSVELPFDKTGLNVIWTDDLTPYRSRKVKILNGAHTSVSLAAYLAGLETVREYACDPVFSRFLNMAVFDELATTVELSEDERNGYAQAVLERFKNHFVKHYCLSIALNSVSKFKVRVLPSLKLITARTGAVPTALSFALASLIEFYKVKKNDTGHYIGVTAGKSEYRVQDDEDILEFFEDVHKTTGDNAESLTQIVLANSRLWDEDLTLIKGLTHAVCSHVENIRKNGIKKAVEEIL